MKMLLVAPIILAMSLSASAEEAQKILSPVDRALEITQVLATRVCTVNANLDPAALMEKSSALAFYAALLALGSQDTLQKLAGPLSVKAGQLHCDHDGILQL